MSSSPGVSMITTGPRGRSSIAFGTGDSVDDAGFSGISATEDTDMYTICRRGAVKTHSFCNLLFCILFAQEFLCSQFESGNSVTHIL